jgi:hypothetical protein
MFQVAWLPRAVNDLAEIGNHGDPNLRQSMTRAAHAIDQALQLDPFGSGESREAGIRVMFAPPLGVRFKVDQESRVAIVGQIWLTPPPRKRS